MFGTNATPLRNCTPQVRSEKRGFGVLTTQPDNPGFSSSCFFNASFSRRSFSSSHSHAICCSPFVLIEFFLSIFPQQGIHRIVIEAESLRFPVHSFTALRAPHPHDFIHAVGYFDYVSFLALVYVCRHFHLTSIAAIHGKQTTNTRVSLTSAIDHPAAINTRGITHPVGSDKTLTIDSAVSVTLIKISL